MSVIASMCFGIRHTWRTGADRAETRTSSPRGFIGFHSFGPMELYAVVMPGEIVEVEQKGNAVGPCQVFFARPFEGQGVQLIAVEKNFL